MANTKTNLIRFIKALFIGAAFFFIGKVFQSNWEHIRSYSWELNISYLLISFTLLAVVFAMFIGGWYFILRTLNIRLPLAKVGRIWITSQFGKYIPGSIWQFVGRIAFLNAQGVSKKRALLSIHLEAAASILAAILTMLTSLLLCSSDLREINLPLIIAALFSCLTLLHPKVLEVAINTLFKLLKREEVKVDYSFGHILSITAYYIVAWFTFGLTFFFLVRSIYFIDYTLFFNIVFAFTTAYVIGFISIFAPGGIGIREGFLIFFLNQILPQFITPVISLAARLWTVLGEVICFLTVLLISKISGEKDE